MSSKKSYAAFWEQQLHPGVTWASIEDDCFKWRTCISPPHEVKEFSLSVWDQDGADQANWTQFLCPHGPEMCSSTWISLKTATLIPKTDHRCHHRMLTHRHQYRNHQHWSHALLAEESIISLYSSQLNVMNRAAPTVYSRERRFT